MKNLIKLWFCIASFVAVLQLSSWLRDLLIHPAGVCALVQDPTARDYFIQHMNFLSMEALAEVETCVEVRDPVQ